jgi:hypothetical protein
MKLHLQQHLIRIANNTALMLVLLISATSSVWAQASDPVACKAFCTSDKTQCRRDADSKAAINSDPPYAITKLFRTGEPINPVGSAPENDGKNRASALRFEFQQKCDATYMRCTRVCDEAK